MKKTSEKKLGKVIIFLITMFLMGSAIVNASIYENKQGREENKKLVRFIYMKNYLIFRGNKLLKEKLKQ